MTVRTQLSNRAQTIEFMQHTVHAHPKQTNAPCRTPVAAGLPLIGNLLAVSIDPLKFVVDNARAHPYVSFIKVMGGGLYHIADAELIEQVLVTHSTRFIKDKSLKVQGRRVFGDGLLSSDGEFWLRQRRLAQPAFHRQRIATYADIMTASTQSALAAWKSGETRDVHTDMMHLTLDVVAQTLFGANDAVALSEIGACLDAIMERFNSRGLSALLENLTGRVIDKRLAARYAWATERLDQIVDAVIAERRRDGRDHGDLLSMFIEARDDDGTGMSDQQLRDECKTMFLAGHETTALSLSWTFWLLAQIPAAKQMLHDELTRVLGGRAPVMSDLSALTYTEQVIKESMRLMPPAWAIQREALEDVEIGGYRIPKGSDVLLSQYATQRDARYFEAPERFLPERWTPEFAKALPKFAYFPFGGGPRLCIGLQFAMMEAVLMLATIYQRFDLELVPGQRVEPQPSITMRPRYGLKMRIRAP
jgi:cytochrome P450